MEDQLAEERAAYGGGHIKLHRQLLESSLFAMRPEDWKIATFLLLKANWKDAEWHNKWQRTRVTIKRGELITSLDNLSVGCKLSIQTVRTSLRHLSEDGFIVILNSSGKSTRQFSHIKICKYDTYQNQIFQANTPLTKHQHASNTPLTTNEEREESKEREEITIGARKLRAPSPNPKIHIDKLELTDSMKDYASTHGINGRVVDLFGDMVGWAHKNNHLVKTLRGWQEEFRTFVNRSPQYNPQYIESNVKEYKPSALANFGRESK